MPPPSLQGLKQASPVSKITDTSPQGQGAEPQHDIYQDSTMGPFMCSNCDKFVAPGECTEPFIVQLQGPTVDPSGCCDLFDSLNNQGGSPSLYFLSDTGKQNPMK